MSANIKCYDPATGRVLFDLASHVTKLLKVFGADINEATHRFSDDEMGGGSLFWYTTDPVNIGGGQAWIGINSTTYDAYSSLTVNITDNQIYFKKTSDITLYVGVKI